MDFEPGAVIGKYVVERRIGRGRAARVFRVRHRELGAAHALKVIDRDQPALAEQLRTQSRCQAEIRHPNVVGVHDLLEIDGDLGLLTELVDGPSLARVLEEGAPGLDLIDEIACGILKGVRVAHLNGLVHGDLKPGNVLLAYSPYPRADDGVVPKISDFGLCPALAARGPTSLAALAPEQIAIDAPAEPGVRTDIYALGVLLYTLCTGQRPHDADDLATLAEVFRSGGGPPVESLVPSLPDRMVWTLGRALALDPADRFGSVDEMLDSWRGVVEATVWHPGLVARPPDPSAGPTEILPRIVAAPAEPPAGGDDTQPSLPRPVPPALAPGTPDWRWPAVAAVLGAGGGAGLVAAVGVALFGGGLLLSAQPNASREPGSDRLARSPASLALPPTPAVPAVTAPADPPAPAAPARGPGPAGVPAAVPPDATPTATVTLVGDAEKIRLRDGERWFDVGPVPAGRYRLAVTFPGADELQLDTVVALEVGQTVTIDCRRAFFACSLR